MENNNTREASSVWFVYTIDEGEGERFFISPILETPKEYNEVWKDTQEYKEKKFKEYVRDDTPFDEILYEVLRDFNESIETHRLKSAIDRKSSAEMQKNNTSIDIDDDDVPF